MKQAALFGVLGSLLTVQVAAVPQPKDVSGQPTNPPPSFSSFFLGPHQVQRMSSLTNTVLLL